MNLRSVVRRLGPGIDHALVELVRGSVRHCHLCDCREEEALVEIALGEDVDFSLGYGDGAASSLRSFGPGEAETGHEGQGEEFHREAGIEVSVE